ncbi:MAG TPA: endonuclease NucS [Acidimicrobiales bacterium]|nr:endonuclease NucS [Acidimicrobiales bacterium]
MRLVIATCTVDYEGRLSAHLPEAPRLLLVKNDGSISIHSDDRAYKPLNWMNPPCRIVEEDGDDGARRWVVSNPKGETLTITITEIHTEMSHDLGVAPGLVKDGVEAHLQELLAANPATIEPGLTLVRREYPTDIGPVDLLCRDGEGRVVAIEVKRVGEIASVDQLTRYLERLERDSRLAGLRGVLVATSIKPQATVLARDRGIGCVEVDYAALRGLGTRNLTLF